MAGQRVPRPARSDGKTAPATKERAPWGTISRRTIVDEATRIIAEGGFETMTIRTLASALGVAPMTLYGHVQDKDDLLDEVVDGLLATAWEPSVDELDWRRWVSEAAERLHRFLVEQPAALYVYLRHPVTSPAALARMKAMLRVLGRANGSAAAARRAYAAIHTYTVGFAALEASRARSAQAPSSGDALSDQLASYTSPRQFRDGLGYLLDGVARGTRHKAASSSSLKFVPQGRSIPR